MSSFECRTAFVTDIHLGTRDCRAPYLLDFLQPEQVRLLSLDASGHAICGRLADHPKFAKWKDEMAPGEMWSLFGEKWLADGGGPT